MAGINPATGRFDPYYNGGENYFREPWQVSGPQPGTTTVADPAAWAKAIETATGGGIPATGPAAPPPPPAPSVSATGATRTQRRTGGWVDVMQQMSDGTWQVVDSYQDFGARDSVIEMFRAAGLDQNFINGLMSSIDGVYSSNVMPTDAQILNSIYSSDAYKTRFAGNELIRKRIADGSGRPGDRLLNPKEYMDLEAAYRQVLQDARMPTGFYDSPEDFTNMIGNSISVSELKGRVDTAFDVLNNSDGSIKSALAEFYNLTDGDLVAYLLDPAKAQPLLLGKTTNEFGLNDPNALRRAYEVAKVGGEADRQGMDSDKALSEEIVTAGLSGQAKDAIGAAAGSDTDLRRLGSLYSDPLDYRDLVKESLSLSGGAASGRKRRKLASKERAAFGGQGALDRTSFSSAADV